MEFARLSAVMELLLEPNNVMIRTALVTMAALLLAQPSHFSVALASLQFVFTTVQQYAVTDEMKTEKVVMMETS